MTEINIHGPITGQTFDGESGFSASLFGEQIKDLDPDDDLTLNINSPGGSVFEGLTIYQMATARAGKTHVVIQGVAASIASVIAMAGDTITMGQASRFMIHNPMGPSALAFGHSKDLREAAAETLKTAELLDSIRDTVVDLYAARTGQSPADLTKWMDAERWITAKEAPGIGFADSVIPNKTVTACTDWDLSAYQPEALALDELEQLAELCRTFRPEQPAGPTGSLTKLALAKARLKLII